MIFNDLTVIWMCPTGSWFTGTQCCSSMLRTMLWRGSTTRWRPTTLRMARSSFMMTQMRYGGFLFLPLTQAEIETQVPALTGTLRSRVWCNVKIQVATPSTSSYVGQVTVTWKRKDGPINDPWHTLLLKTNNLYRHLIIFVKNGRG